MPRPTAAAVLALALLGVSSARAADGVGKAPVAARNAASGAHPVNLQVLPKDTPYVDVVLRMNRFSRELGVQCVFCHAQNPQTQVVDFASDESPAKLVARIMMGMVRDINDKYLAQVSDRRYAVAISCGNCHQGQTFPPAYEAGSP